MFLVMICKNIHFNEVTDLADVDQFGFVDLADCLSNGEVPADLNPTDDQYNGIEDPSEILGKPSDVFEAYKMQDYVKSVGTVKEEGQSTD